jgi:hypothetical protein
LPAPSVNTTPRTSTSTSHSGPFGWMPNFAKEADNHVKFWTVPLETRIMDGSNAWTGSDTVKKMSCIRFARYGCNIVAVEIVAVAGTTSSDEDDGVKTRQSTRQFTTIHSRPQYEQGLWGHSPGNATICNPFKVRVFDVAISLRNTTSRERKEPAESCEAKTQVDAATAVRTAPVSVPFSSSCTAIWISNKQPPFAKRLG